MSWSANGCPMFGQHTDILKSAHATVCALKHRTTVCCPTYRTNVWLFSCDINCLHSPKVLFSWFSLNYLFLFVPIYRSTVCAQTDSKRTSEIFVNRFCTNGQQTDVQTINQPFVHINVRLTIWAQVFQCTNSAQELSLSDTSDSKWTFKIYVNRLISVIFCCVPRNPGTATSYIATKY